jgi:Cof subfamily protein (haloacid dehalogenase superfamily)
LIELDSELAAKLRKIRLVLADIDGTLVSADKPTFDNVLTQLRKLKPLRIGFSIATGRTIRGASFVTSQLHHSGSRLPPMITYNGAVVLAGKDSTLLSRRMIGIDHFRAVIEACRRRSLPTTAYACGSQLDFVPHETVYSESAEAPASDFNGMEIRRVSDLTAVDDDFVAILVEVPTGTGEGLLAELQGELGDRVRVTTSGGRYIEICNTLGTKLNAMAELAKMQQLTVDEIMTIGDNYNDLEMITGAGVGVAVANAPEPIRASATFQTSLPSGQGVVEALRALIRAVRSSPRPHDPVADVVVR